MLLRNSLITVALFLMCPPGSTSAQCQPDEILDCDGDCAPASWLGDGICDSSGRFYKGNSIDFSCFLDGGDCVLDCDGDGAPIYWVGDGVCDAGGRFYHGNSIDLGCIESGLDGGDCVLDCDEDGAPSDWVGDGICDSGGRFYHGNSIDLACIENGIDGDDCVLDCDGDGAPADWIADGICDGGGRFYHGNSIDLGCLQNNLDGGDCVLDCDGDPAPTAWVGDGICDSGGQFHHGNSIDLACIQNDIDGGDCVLDCDGDGVPFDWIGDGICDDGDRFWHGNSIHLFCQAFNYDMGDCTDTLNDLNDVPSGNNPPSQNQYDKPEPPSPGEHNLVYITHGMWTSEDKFFLFWNQLKHEIISELDQLGTKEQWTVRAWNWSSNSYHAPWTILSYAKDEGRAMGDEILNMMATNRYDHIHFIGHSAGAMVISKAAERINAAFPFGGAPAIHSTFLDAYVGPTGAQEDYYGSESTWSDHYLSWENPVVGSCGLSTSLWTQFDLDFAFNVNITFIDPEWTLACNSSHTWPTCMYRHSISGNAAPCPPPVEGAAAYLPYGFNLSKEWLGDSWESTVANFKLGDGDILDLPEGQAPPQQVLMIRTDDPFDFETLPHSMSDPSDVAFEGTRIVLVNDQATPTWVNFELNTTQPINFVTLSAGFTSASSAQGLLTVYINGQEFGRVDERYANKIEMLEFNMPADLGAGSHILSVRLDRFTGAASVAHLENVATGFGAFAKLGDIDASGSVNVDDLLAIINSWGTCPTPPESCSADIAPSPDGDGTVDVDDLLLVINNWG